MAKEEKSETIKTGKGMQIVVFKLGNEEYGMQIDHIKEVVITPNITRMPQSASYIRGVANVRGNVIAILDLEERFNLERVILEKGGRYTLVVESEEMRMGLLVSDVPNTITVNSAEIDTNAGIVGDGQTDSGYIKGIVKSGNRLIILVDIFKVVDYDAVVSMKKAHIAA
ncbi:chemotaxis protein CheW [Chryseolinea sp. T2]|uniref:chemotaxis protein CheW n=1 Tax=Chryseolinea sp. T2 TaxID=3129255 RepID=UPI0030773F5B